MCGCVAASDSPCLVHRSSLCLLPCARRCPQELYEGKNYTDRSDVYALAMVMWEVLTGEVPFDRPELRQLLQPEDHAVNIGERGLRPEIPRDTPEEFARLVRWGWSTKPEDRPSAKELARRLDSMLEVENDENLKQLERGSRAAGPFTEGRSSSGDRS